MGVRASIYGVKGEASSFACVTYDDKDATYNGVVSSGICVAPSNNLACTIPVHKRGFNCAMRWAAGKLYSAGKDGNIRITNKTPLGSSLTRAIGVAKREAHAGLRDGTIYLVNVTTHDQ